MEQLMGPIELLVVEFPGNQFNGEIIPALSRLVDAGLIQIIDLSVLAKDHAGSVTIVEPSELTGEIAEALMALEGQHDDLFSETDLLMAAEGMPNNSTAAALLFENVWAAKFAEAVRAANGEVLANVRIPPEVVAAARQSLAEGGG